MNNKSNWSPTTASQRLKTSLDRLQKKSPETENITIHHFCQIRFFSVAVGYKQLPQKFFNQSTILYYTSIEWLNRDLTRQH